MMRQFRLSNQTSIRQIKAIDLIVDNAKQWVILFHGFGADAYDLQSLSEAIKAPVPLNWLFPQGVLEVPIGPGWTGRAWWSLDMEALQRRSASGADADLSGENPSGLETLRPAVLEMIESLGVGWENIVLGGFSQGAMLATDIFLQAPKTPKGLIVMSGSLIKKSTWLPLLSNRKGSRYFLCHGKQDMVLPHKGAQQLESFFNGAGLKGKLLSFEGGHEIPMLAIHQANAYLKEIFS